MELQAMQAGINNPDINRALGQGIRGGIPQSVLTSHQIVIEDGKSKTANISDILGQVNKKSKSTKH